MKVAAYQPTLGLPRTGMAQRVKSVRQVRIDLEGVMAVCATLVFFGVLLMRLPDPVSGADGGNWLMLSQAFIGVQANAASTVYPPGFHLMLLGLQQVLPPLEALRVAGAAVSVLPGLACYGLLRGLGCGVLALAGLAATLTGFSLEMLAWGGYPQLMGTGLAIGSLAALVSGFRSGANTRFVIAGMLAGLTMLTHHLAALQALICLGTTCVVAIAAAGRDWRVRLRQASIVLGVLILSTIPAIPTYIILVTQAGPSAFNANGFDLAGIAQYLTNEAPTLWLPLTALVPFAFAIRTYERARIDVAALLGLAVASLGLTLVTYELRAAYLFQALAIASAGIVFAYLIGHGNRVGRLAVATIAAAFFVALASAGVERLDRSLRFYAVLDASVVDGLQWLAQNREPGDLAIVTRGAGKGTLGWWVQGISHVPSYLDYDPRWLYFRQEKEQAQIARSVLANTDPQAAAMEARQQGVTLIVFDARFVDEADAWLRSGRVFGAIGLVYSNPSLAIFRISSST